MTLQSLLNDLATQSALLSMWGALILHWLFPLYESHLHPTTLWRYGAQIISEKANHATDSEQQQRLSGTLAFSLLLLGASLLLFIISYLQGSNLIFDTLLLWLAFGWKPLFDKGDKLEQLLAHAKKPAARMLLGKMVKRDTQALSSSELAKLSCETATIGVARTLVNVLFFFAIAGAEAAFIYSLLMQLNREWSPRLKRYQYFGASLSKTLAIIEWLPSRLFALLLATGRGFIQVANIFRAKPASSNAELILQAVASKYQISLGGSAIYDDKEIFRTHLGGEALPSAQSFSRLKQDLTHKAIGWVILQSFFLVVLL